MDNLRLWHKFLQTIKPAVSPVNYKAYFLKSLLKSVDEDKIILTVPSAFILETLTRDYKKLIEQTFTNLLSKTVAVELTVKEFEKNPKDEADDFFQTPYSQPITLNSRYTLKNFVVGPSNNLAYAAAEAVVQNPGTSYNPLFVYGGTGVGKTHLIVGIGNALLGKRPHLKIIYCSSDQFMNDYVEAIQNRRMADLRRKYRSADILLIDDIQFFSGREGTQEEFFHTFNELQSKNSQMVITSDRSPHQIDKLEDRLKSRFAGGLMLDIQSPDFDTRVAILKAKCQERGENLPEESIRLLASSLESNIRELEGRLIQILQSLKQKNLPPTPNNINLHLSKPLFSSLNLNPKQIMSVICDYFDLTIKDLTGPNRQKEVVLPRHIAMYLLSEEADLTVEKIGQLLGGRDHTTIMHGRDKIKKLISIDREVQRIFIEVKNKLLSTSYPQK